MAPFRTVRFGSDTASDGVNRSKRNRMSMLDSLRTVRFTSSEESEESKEAEEPPPQTRWKSDLCFPLRACICFPCALGDLMERIGLGIFGERTPKWCLPAWNAILFVFGLYFILCSIIVATVGSRCLQSTKTEAEACNDWEKILAVVFHNIAFLLAFFLASVLVMARYYLRRRDNIRTEFCCSCCPFVCEDVLCSFCCSTLTLIQMHRHVEDHKECRRQMIMEEKNRKKRSSRANSNNKKLEVSKGNDGDQMKEGRGYVHEV